MKLENVRKTFTKYAPIYNATHTWTLLKRCDARLALDLKPSAADQVYDVVNRLNFPHQRELVGLHGQVVVADLTPAMLDIARKINL